MTLKLGIPSKGRLMADTFDWFAERGVSISRTGTDREYAGRVDGVDGVELVLLSAGEIPRELEAGRIHLGVTGSDVVREKIARWDTKVAPLAELGFGHADLVMAVPKTWVDVRDLNDLDAAADAFRRTHGFRLRIATKYHRLVRAHLKAAGVASYQLVDSQGATEAAVPGGYRHERGGRAARRQGRASATGVDKAIGAGQRRRRRERRTMHAAAGGGG